MEICWEKYSEFCPTSCTKNLSDIFSDFLEILVCSKFLDFLSGHWLEIQTLLDRIKPRRKVIEVVKPSTQLVSVELMEITKEERKMQTIFMSFLLF